LAEQCEGKFSVENRTLTEAKCFSDILRRKKIFIDAKLKFSNENFKQTADDFFKDRTITPLSQSTPTPALPTPHLLHQVVFKAHKCFLKKKE
jgi:hypothetical protein